MIRKHIADGLRTLRRLAARMHRPVLFCYDGSDGSKIALAAASELVVHPADAVVLTIWTPATILLARAARWERAYVPARERSTSRRQHRSADCHRRRRGCPPARYTPPLGSPRRPNRFPRRSPTSADEIDRPADRLRATGTGVHAQRPARQRLARNLRSRQAAGADRSSARAMFRQTLSSSRRRAALSRPSRGDARRRIPRANAALRLHS